MKLSDLLDDVSASIGINITRPQASIQITSNVALVALASTIGGNESRAISSMSSVLVRCRSSLMLARKSCTDRRWTRKASISRRASSSRYKREFNRDFTVSIKQLPVLSFPLSLRLPFLRLCADVEAQDWTQTQNADKLLLTPKWQRVLNAHLT